MNSQPQLGKVAVIYGGNSSEREISIVSGEYVHSILQNIGIDVMGCCIDEVGEPLIRQLKSNKIDLVFIMLHGGDGEDGTFQAMLEQASIAYTGSNSKGCKQTMDKALTKSLWAKSGLPVPNHVNLHAGNLTQATLDTVGGKAVVKASCEGSSNGVHIVSKVEELITGYADALSYTTHGRGHVFAEAFINGRELTFGVVDNKVFPAIEIQVANGFYDFYNKYQGSNTQYICPAELDAGLADTLKALALKAFISVGCSHWGRVDLMLDNRHQPWLIEVNTVPGMTERSLVPKAAQVAGISVNELLLSIAQLGSSRGVI